MRAVCRAVKALLLFSAFFAAVRYVCQGGYAPKEFNSLCHYSNPSLWDHMLAEKYPTYQVVVHPKLQSGSKWIQEKTTFLCDKYASPSLAFIKEKCSEHQCQRVIDSFYLKYVYLVERVKFWYNGVIKPNIMTKLINPYHLDKKCISIRQKWVLLSYWVSNHYECAKNCAIKKIGQYKVDGFKAILPSKTSKETIKVATSPNVTPVSSTNTSTDLETSSLSLSMKTAARKTVEANTEEEKFEDASDEFDEDEDEEEDEETIVSTSTVFKTVTIHSSTQSQQSEAAGVSSDVSDQTNESSKEVIIDENDALQEQFDQWTSSIESKVKSIFKLLDKEVLKSASKLTNATETKLRPAFQLYTEKVETLFRNISSAIKDIDCKEELDPNTGEKLFFDKSGTTQLERYVDRQYVRDIFNNLSQVTDNMTDTVQFELNHLMKSVNDRVEYLRNDYVDLYEEWANVMINEWSKRLVYADVVGGVVMDANDDSEVDSRSDANWKRFLEVKKQVVAAREELINHKVVLKNVEKFVKRVEHTLEVLIKENGEFSYILRAKANIAFQQREKEESDLKRQQEEEALKRKQEVELKLKLKEEKEQEIDEKLPEDEADPVETFEDSEGVPAEGD